MAEIRNAVCGKLSLYNPDGEQLNRTEIYQLYHYGEKGSVIVQNENGKETAYRIQPDDPDLATALERIRELLQKNPDCPRKNCLFIHEVFMDDQTLRSVPYDALYDILKKLFRRQQFLNTYHEPQLAGAVVCPGLKPNMISAMNACPPAPGLFERMKQEQERLMQEQIPKSAAPNTENSPAQPQETVLHEDGTWECSCGAKGLTANFCFNCGQARPKC